MTNLETKTNQAIANLNDDLLGYAARAALLELQASWLDAIRDGVKPAALVTDIDLVIAQLRQAQKTIGA
jgi:hypothetical protein